MRSEQIHKALIHVPNRFAICRMVAKGVRVTHKPGSRFEDSIGDVLFHLGTPGSAGAKTEKTL